MLTMMLDGGSARSVDLDDAAYNDTDAMNDDDDAMDDDNDAMDDDDDDDDHDYDDYAGWWVCQVTR